MNINTRRNFISSLSKIGVILPLLEAVPSLQAQRKKPPKDPINLVCLSAPLGFARRTFNPNSPGLKYVPSPVLRTLRRSGLPHTVITGGTLNIFDRAHRVDSNTWTALHPSPNGKWLGNGISLDQKVAEFYQGQTFVPYVNMIDTPSFNKRGISLPSYRNSSQLINNVFKPINIGKAKNIYNRDTALVDFINTQVKAFKKDLSRNDNERLGDYIESLGNVERLSKEKYNWSLNYTVPEMPSLTTNDVFMEKYKSKYLSRHASALEGMKLTLEAGMTRVASFAYRGNDFDLKGVKDTWHGNTHHGNRADKKAELKLLDIGAMNVLVDFIISLSKTKTVTGKSLLDNTVVLMCCGLGDANSHSATTSPFFAVGGGLNHKGHVVYSKSKRPLIANFYTEILQHIGLEVDSFGNSKKASNIWS